MNLIKKMTNQNKFEYYTMLWSDNLSEGKRIMDEKGAIETIYKIEYGFGKVKYISTIDISDRGFKMLRTYKLDENKTEIVAKIKKLILNNLEKTTLDHIESEIGLDLLAAQLN